MQKRSPPSSTESAAAYRCVRENDDAASRLLWDGKEMKETK